MTTPTRTMEFFFQWHLTERCNLRCTHCYQEDGKVGEVPLSKAKEIVRIAYDTIQSWSDTYKISFSPSFNVTGGEPFLSPFLPKILRYLKTKKFDIFLLTNGTMINREKAQMLSEIPVQGVQVSIEGSEAIHNQIRGKGSFKKAMKGVSQLVDAGLIVTLNVTLLEINCSYLKDLVELASSAGAQRLGFSRLVPYGRGKDLINRIISQEKLRQIYEDILAIRNDKVFIATGDPVASQIGVEIDDGHADIPLGGCAAGVSGITILSDGTLTPCRRLGIPVGNILKNSLREIWATSPVLESLRTKTLYKGKCGTCARWSQCRGCRAIAYAYSFSQGIGDYLAEDPQCFIENSSAPQG
ncbi:MAG: radical family protein [Deltaproteobacteria bacterium]|nr:radical family protein [Deltaproteobacteria bacterium]